MNFYFHSANARSELIPGSIHKTRNCQNKSAERRRIQLRRVCEADNREAIWLLQMITSPWISISFATIPNWFTRLNQFLDNTEQALLHPY